MIGSGSQSKTVVNFDSVYRIVWWLGTALIVLSWLNAVTNLVGGIGVVISGTATVTSLVNGVIARRKNPALQNNKSALLPLDAKTLYSVLWILGIVLVFLSNQRVLSDTLGTVGWGMTIVAVIISLFVKPKAQPIPLIPVIPAAPRKVDPDRPIDVTFTKTLIKIELFDGRIIKAPLNWYPKLKDASEEDRNDFEFQGTAIFWPTLKADVSVPDVLAGTPPEE